MNPVTRVTNRVSDQYPNDECYTIEDIVKEVNLHPIRTRQLLKIAIEKRAVINLSKKEGVRVLYPEPMAKKFIELYKSGGLTKGGAGKRGRPSKSASDARRDKNALMFIKIPIFDAKIRDVLIQQFKTEEGVVKHFTEKMFELTKPIVSELDLLEAEYIQKRNQLLTR